MKLSIVMPAYNEEATIEEAIRRVSSVDYGVEVEIIVVEDGSSDATKSIVERVAQDLRGIRPFSNPKNMGKGYSIRRGIAESLGDIIVIQDADLEYDPVQIPSLLSPLIDGSADVVFGSRFMGESKNQSLVFYLGNKILNVCFNVIFLKRMTDIETCYKLTRKEVFTGLNLKSDGFEIEGEITAKLVKKGCKLVELPIKYLARDKKQKKINVWDGVKTLYLILKVRLNLL